MPKLTVFRRQTCIQSNVLKVVVKTHKAGRRHGQAGPGLESRADIYAQPAPLWTPQVQVLAWRVLLILDCQLEGELNQNLSKESTVPGTRSLKERSFFILNDSA